MIRFDYEHGDQLQACVLANLSAQLRAALATQARVSLALAGGKTPLPIYAALAELALDWPRVDLIATDERCVALAHESCNHRALQHSFAAASGVQIHPLFPLINRPELAQESARTAVANCAPDEFDLVLLGMGTDGHFASLFPGDPILAQALDLQNAESAYVIEPDPLPPEAPFARITLSLHRLLKAKRALLVIQGQPKQRVLETALADPNSTYPIARLLHSGFSPLEVHWSP